MNYLGTPHKTANHLTPLNFLVDFDKRRAIVIEGRDPHIVLTSVQDTAAVVAAAIDYEGRWPTVGGIQGHRVTLSELIKIGEHVRGMFPSSPTRASPVFLTSSCRISV
jgi:hypothetical protein